MAIHREPGRVVYSGDDRIEVEVLVHGDNGKEWVAGELRSWDQDADGNWSAMVSYRLGVASSTSPGSTRPRSGKLTRR